MSELWAWNVSAWVYARTYGPLAHRLDEDVFSWLGREGLAGKVVMDCGCGPGVVARKLVELGAAKVICVDVSPKMLEQVGDDPRLIKVQARLEPGELKPIADQYAPEGVDVVLFKRSLYHPTDVAVEVLREAHGLLKPGGQVVVVHPERKILPYAFGRPLRVHRHTPYHLFNRTISKIGVRLGGEQYTVHTRDELLSLARRAAGENSVSEIPTSQGSFNLIALTRAADAA